LINDGGGSAVALKADVGIEAEVEAAVAKAVEVYGRLDIMLANAGKAVNGFGTTAFEDSARPILTTSTTRSTRACSSQASTRRG
jgi:NAD(P)-dependent dehydrogenase (short-subunit alcohol dehydrogenase family)